MVYINCATVMRVAQVAIAYVVLLELWLVTFYLWAVEMTGIMRLPAAQESRPAVTMIWKLITWPLKSVG
jgi:hypothetical protein